MDEERKKGFLAFPSPNAQRMQLERDKPTAHCPT
jgi:hypothetical protein